MRLQSAVSMSSLQGWDNFGREDRDERRDLRRRRRSQRQKRRRTRRAGRYRSRAERLDDGRSERRPTREKIPKRRSKPASAQPAEAPQPWSEEAALQPAPQTWEQSWDEPEVVDVEWEEEPEWMGAARRARLPARWSPPAKMGTHLRIQASEHHRAAVIALRPGLFLVAELPEQVARSEFGVAAVLAPLVIKAASKAIQYRQQTEPTQRPLYRLLHRDQDQARERPGQMLQRVFNPKKAQASAPVAQQPPALQLAPGAGHGAHALLPPPEMGWAQGLVLEPLGVLHG
jgi:hypothetical protein